MPGARSHHYQFRLQTLLVHTGGPVATAMGLLIVAGILDGLNVLPSRGPKGNADQVGLHHQFQLSRSEHPAEIVLTGDSSCMMGVDAVELGRNLGGAVSAVNLGLVIDLDMDVYAEAAKSFI